MCNKEKFWPVLADLLGRPEWAGDPDFANYPARLKNRDRLTRMLDDALMANDTTYWLARFAGKVPCAPVNDIAQALESDFVRERDAIRDYAYPDGRGARMIANPLRFPDCELPQRAAPALGADTDEILCALGYDHQHIAALRQRGILR